MIEVILIAVGKVKNESIYEEISSYAKRLKPYMKIKVFEIEPYSFTENTREQAVRVESEKILRAMANQKAGLVVALDEKGKECDSKEFASFVETGQQPLVFIIGGALGLSEDVKKEATEMVSLSRLTLPHELARLVFYEQLYRASTIIHGKTYHY